MKRSILAGLFQLGTLFAYAQQASGINHLSITSRDKILVVESSMDIPAWHEKNFWSLYHNYLKTHEQATSSTYRAMYDLGGIDPSMGEQEIKDRALNLLALRAKQLQVETEYFKEMSEEFNGVIALQFLQTEILLDLMEGAKIYDATRWKKYKFYTHNMTPAQQSAKYNIIAAALPLSPDNAPAFYKVYAKYEAECDLLIGENYSMYSLFSGPPSDFTPGLAKRIGQNLITVMQREMKLKEKYFHEMNAEAGPKLAAGFLAWEDYFSITNKMHVWAENQ